MMKAMSITSDLLQRDRDISLIFTANDQMALGAVEAARIAKVTPTIIGVDGTEAGLKAVREGKLTATVSQLPYVIGERAIELIKVEGRGHVVFTDTPVLSAEQLNKSAAP